MEFKSSSRNVQFPSIARIRQTVGTYTYIDAVRDYHDAARGIQCLLLPKGGICAYAHKGERVYGG